MVANAIYHSRIPVVTGIGHEDDLTIADMVADKRALTPSEAAEQVVPNQTDVLGWLAKLEAQFRGLLRRNLDLAQSRLDALARRRCFREPLDRIQNEEQRLDELFARLGRAIDQRQARAQARLEALTAHLESLSPLNVLARGYSLTRHEDEHHLLRSATEVEPGDRLVTRLHQGKVVSRVETILPSDTTSAEEVSHERSAAGQPDVRAVAD